MQSISKVLVVIDPTADTQPALLRALQLAANHPIEILLYDTVYFSSMMSDSLMTSDQQEITQSSIIKNNEQKLQQLISQFPASQATLTTKVEWHPLRYAGIIHAAEKFGAELILKSTHSHSATSRLLFESTDWQLLDKSPLPVWLVKSEQWNEHTTAVAAVDPINPQSQESELDKRILTTAYQVSKQLDLPLHACHCFDPGLWEMLSESIYVAGLWKEVFPQQPAKEDRSIIENLRYDHRIKFTETCQEMVPNSEHQHMLSGDIKEILPDLLASLNAGILILGTSYRDGLLGSTAEKLLELVECDVLAVKPKGFSSLV